VTTANRRLDSVAPAGASAIAYQYVCDGCSKRATAKHTHGWRTLVLDRGFLETSDHRGSVDHVVEFHLCGKCDDELDHDKVMRALVTAIQG
jgi:hypothetical protein